jgi:hypothetical protein
VAYYAYGIKVTNATQSTIEGNGFYDSTAATTALIRFEAASGYNVVTNGLSLVGSGTVPVSDSNGTNSIQSTLLGGTAFTQLSIFNVIPNYLNTNYERFFAGWGGNIMQFATTAAGTGVARDIALYPGAQLHLGSGGTDRWAIVAGGNLVAWADNTYDIGITGTTLLRPRNIHLSGNLQFGRTSADSLIKASGTTVSFRLGDDSGDASITAGNGSTGHATCWNGTKISYCTSLVAADGTCTCH